MANSNSSLPCAPSARFLLVLSFFSQFVTACQGHHHGIVATDPDELSLEVERGGSAVVHDLPDFKLFWQQRGVWIVSQDGMIRKLGVECAEEVEVTVQQVCRLGQAVSFVYRLAAGAFVLTFESGMVGVTGDDDCEISMRQQSCGVRPLAVVFVDNLIMEVDARSVSLYTSDCQAIESVSRKEHGSGDSPMSWVALQTANGLELCMGQQCASVTENDALRLTPDLHRNLDDGPASLCPSGTAEVYLTSGAVACSQGSDVVFECLSTNDR